MRERFIYMMLGFNLIQDRREQIEKRRDLEYDDFTPEEYYMYATGLSFGCLAWAISLLIVYFLFRLMI